MTEISSRHLVDPQLLGLLDSFPPLRLSNAILPILRANPMSRPDTNEGVGQVEITRLTAPGPDGAPEVPLFVYRPVSAGVKGCILHIHGGGYVVGSAESMQATHRAIAARLDCCIVSVEYRLAPETRFPGAVEDCYAALAWLVQSAAELGVDPARIGIMGESAGGGLAAGLALLVRDRGEFILAFQHLIYPMIDDRTCSHADPHPFAGEFVWTSASNHFGWSALLGVEPGSEGVSPYAAAARAADLSGLPPTFISTGALDLFLEEDMDYARRLTRAGVPVEFHIYPGAYHAFNVSPDAAVASQATRDSLTALARALG